MVVIMTWFDVTSSATACFAGASSTDNETVLQQLRGGRTLRRISSHTRADETARQCREFAR